MTAPGNIEILKEIQGFDYYRVFLNEGIYEDGRALTEERPYLIKVGLNKNSAGSSFVQCQGCVVSCKVTAKAGYYDPKQCVRFRLERANCIPKREFNLIRAVLNDFSRRHIFVDPQTLVFDTEYQIQLILTLTLNNCDGFLLGAILTAINAALLDTKIPTISAELDHADDEDMEDDAMCKRLMRRRDKFRVDMTKMVPLKVRDQPHYSGFIVHDAETETPAFLYDPNEQLIHLIRRRVDIITGRDNSIYFWQCATFQNLTTEFRQQIVSMAAERRDKANAILERVRTEGSAESNLTEV